MPAGAQGSVWVRVDGALKTDEVDGQKAEPGQPAEGARSFYKGSSKSRDLGSLLEISIKDLVGSLKEVVFPMTFNDFQ